jgi:hypothetical protein
MDIAGNYRPLASQGTFPHAGEAERDTALISLAPFLPMPAAELRDQPVTVEQVWLQARLQERSS